MWFRRGLTLDRDLIRPGFDRFKLACGYKARPRIDRTVYQIARMALARNSHYQRANIQLPSFGTTVVPFFSFTRLSA